jgi:Co/Zn/Cd efflux system component
VWSLTSGKNIVSMHVRVDSDVDKKKLLIKIHDFLNVKFSIYFSTTQIETECPEDDEAPEINIEIHQSRTKSHIR